jgi:hypothetical protein
VNVFAGKAEVGKAGFCFRLGIRMPVAGSANLAPLLRRVVFIGETTLGRALDFQRIGLRRP